MTRIVVAKDFLSGDLAEVCKAAIQKRQSLSLQSFATANNGLDTKMRVGGYARNYLVWTFIEDHVDLYVKRLAA